MNSRILITSTSIVVFVAAIAGVLMQARQLNYLRAQQRSAVVRIDPTKSVVMQPAGSEPAPRPTEASSTASPSLELLGLRNEVTRLTERRRELSAARGENERLRVQLATSRTNMSAANALPPGYVRTSEARFMGYNTPADTIQSLLWAVQNRDFTNLVEAFTPETARQIQQDVQRSGAEEFFKKPSIIPGMRILSQQQMPDGVIPQ